MPFVVRPQAARPSPPPTPTPTPVGQPKRITWTSAVGDTIDLTSRAGGYFTLTGREGFGPIDADIVADRMASGSSLPRAHRWQPRLMTNPLQIEGKTEAEYLARYRRLQASLRHPIDPDTYLPVPGRITVELPDGSSRFIPALYQGGASPTEDHLDDVLAHWVRLPNLQFYAGFPLWQGADIGRSWQVSPATRPFYPIYPIRVKSSQVLDDATIFNPGDADAFPLWRLRGPGTPTIGNADTGAVFRFSEPIPSGVTVTVDCRPVELAPATGLTALDDQGLGDSSDWWDRFVDFPAFWTVPPGTTHLNLAMTGADETSRIQLIALAGWQGGW